MDTPGTIVVRAFADIPGIEVTAYQDDLFRVFASPSPPSSTRGVELGVRDTGESEADWNYLVTSHPFDP